MDLSERQKEWMERVARTQGEGAIVTGWPDEEFGISEDAYEDYLLDQYSEYLDECVDEATEPEPFDTWKCKLLPFDEWRDAKLEEQGENPGDEEFSRSECDCCGSPLAGSRHAATILHMNKEQDGAVPYTPLSVCQDCLMYIANGDVPDDEYLDRMGD